MIKQSLPAISKVTASSIEEFKNAVKIVALAYLTSSTDTPAPEFSATADAHRDFLVSQQTRMSLKQLESYVNKWNSISQRRKGLEKEKEKEKEKRGCL